MPFTFIHVSDTHLGFSDLEIMDENEKYNIREEDVYNSFAKVIDYAVETKVNFIIHSGDIFHRSSPSNRALVFLSQQLSKLEEFKIPIYIIAGNHDFPKSVFTTPIYNLFDLFKYSKIFFSENYSVYDNGYCYLHTLPHINNETKYNEEAQKICITNTDKPNILITHGSMPNYLMEEYGERVFPEGKLEYLINFDYVALGHWHKFKHLKSYGNVYYSGSTERFSDKETEYQKVFLLCKYDNKLTVEAINIDGRLMKNIKIKECFNKNKNEIIDEILANINNLDIKGGIFTIHLLDMAQLQIYEIGKNDFSEILKEALFYNITKTIKGSDEKIVLDSSSFDLRDYLNEELKKNFTDIKEYAEVFSLTRNILDEIEEEELNED